MHIMMFTERPYYHVPEDEIIKNASYFGIPNSHFDPAKGSELYNEYFDGFCRKFWCVDDLG